jgi:tetratricopeptide (TPR) repeat protein
MDKKKRIFRPQASALLTLMAAVSLATLAVLAAKPLPSSSPAEKPDPLASVLNAMYNAEYAKAESVLRSGLREHPSDFRAWNYLAETILDQEMLRESLFSGEAYLNTGEVFHQRRQPLPAGFEKNLNAALDQATKLETDRLKKNSRDAEALYWLGVTHSVRTEYEFALLRSYFAALREGKLAYKLNQKLLKLDPHDADAYLVIGIADYAMGALPWYVKIMTAVAGIHGNRKHGIEELQRASQDGHYTRVDAKIVLVAIYEREKKYPEARSLLEELERLFPENFLVPMELARVDKAEGDWRAAVRLYDATVEKFVRGEKGSPRIPAAMILYRAGQAHEHLNDYETALQLYEEAGSLPDKSRAVYQSELAAADLNRRLNRLPEARKQYRQVAQAVPNTDLGRAARRALSAIH